MILICSAIEPNGTIDAELEDVVKSSEAALRELHRATARPSCDWGLDLSMGPNTLLTHLSKARQLARLATLRAKLRFQNAQTDQAVDDLLATMVLSRHAAEDAIVISLLVEYAIDKPVIEILVPQVPKMDAASRRRLSEGLARLPASKTMADAVKLEKGLMLEWFIRKFSEPGGRQSALELISDPQQPELEYLRSLSDEELVNAAKQLRPYYDTLGEWMTLPPEELQAKVQQATRQLEASKAESLLASRLISSLPNCRRPEYEHQLRLTELRKALDLRD